MIVRDHVPHSERGGPSGTPSSRRGAALAARGRPSSSATSTGEARVGSTRNPGLGEEPRRADVTTMVTGGDAPPGPRPGLQCPLRAPRLWFDSERDSATSLRIPTNARSPLYCGWFVRVKYKCHDRPGKWGNTDGRMQHPVPGTGARAMHRCAATVTVRDTRGALALASLVGDDELAPVGRPSGYSAHDDGGRIAALDAAGQVAAHEGDTIEASGGAAGVVTLCDVTIEGFPAVSISNETAVLIAIAVNGSVVETARSMRWTSSHGSISPAGGSTCAAGRSSCPGRCSFPTSRSPCDSRRPRAPRCDDPFRSTGRPA